jgi:hypothetical protein
MHNCGVFNIAPQGVGDAEFNRQASYAKSVLGNGEVRAIYILYCTTMIKFCMITV